MGSDDDAEKSESKSEEWVERGIVMAATAEKLAQRSCRGERCWMVASRQ